MVKMEWTNCRWLLSLKAKYHTIPPFCKEKIFKKIQKIKPGSLDYSWRVSCVIACTLEFGHAVPTKSSSPSKNLLRVLHQALTVIQNWIAVDKPLHYDGTASGLCQGCSGVPSLYDECQQSTKLRVLQWSIDCLQHALCLNASACIKLLSYISIGREVDSIPSKAVHCCTFVTSFRDRCQHTVTKAVLYTTCSASPGVSIYHYRKTKALFNDVHPHYPRMNWPSFSHLQ